MPPMEWKMVFIRNLPKGDMCSYKFGPTMQNINSDGRRSMYNYISGAGQKFLVQQNWDPELQKCVSSA